MRKRKKPPAPTKLKTPCILWTGAKTLTGYGVRHFRGHNTTAHRAVWIEKYGPIKSRWIFVCHKCDNPACINIEHLFLGTNTENMRDAVRKGRLRGVHGCRDGEKHPRATITDAQAVAIRAIHAAGVSYPAIARQLGVSKYAVAQVGSGRTFNRLPL